jgi:hypothetical protein
VLVIVMGDRTYKPWVQKHKRPQGFGSWCPPMGEGLAQQLLQRAIPDPDPERSGNKLYVVDKGWCFVAEPTRAEIGEYHGYPLPGAEVPERVLKQLEQTGIISPGERRRLRKQRALPEAY